MLTTLNCPAKINLILKVHHRRPSDGYHLLSSLMCPIDLCDEITIDYHPNAENQFHLEVSFDESLAFQSHKLNTTNENILSKTYQAYQAINPIEGSFKIKLLKRIPIQSGLGGGSSNAATLLNFLNAQHPNPLPIETLEQMALRLGADVPFFMQPDWYWVEGIGEALTPIKLSQPPDWQLLLLRPKTIDAPTEKLFQALNRPILEAPAQPLRPPNTTQLQSFQSLTSLIENDFMPFFQDQYPIIQQLQAWCLSHDLNLGLSGSGSCLFIPYETTQQTVIHQLLQEPLAQAFWAHFTSLGQ